MILTYNLNKCLALYSTGRLDPDIIDPNGVKHINTWINFAIELLRIRGSTPTRISFSFADRTGAMPSFIKTHIIPEQQIPVGTPAYSNYVDICLDRARQLLSTGKQLNVMWSGGLDSTVALFALINQAQNKDQVNILCTFDSILESGTIFDRYLKNSNIKVKFEQTRLEFSQPYSYDYQDPTQLYINGQCGDQLFGPRVSLPIPGVKPTDPWDSGYSRDFMDLIEPSIRLSQRPIETIRDLRWWLFFNHTWTTVLYDDLVDRPVELNQRIHSFYATPEFQKWAITTPTYYENPAQYRWPAKQALGQLIDCQYYIEHKTKGLSNNWRHSDNWYALDTEFQTLYAER